MEPSWKRPLPATPDITRLTQLYRGMSRIRAFETVAQEAHRAREFPGYLHASLGQEAVATGVCAHLRREDRLTSTHRGHGHALAKGADAQAMMLELYGRAEGSCRGKGGSMHIADFSVGMLGANGIVAGGIPIACGAAQGLRLLGSKAIVACFFGDGAINRGPFMEGLNWAALYRLPLLFVCEANTFAAFTRADATTAGGGPLARAESCGVPGLEVDGNDIRAVERAAARLIAGIRAGQGPSMLLAHTYRWEGHTSTDPAGYRTTEEVTAGKSRDPLARFAATLSETGLDPADIRRIDDEALAEMIAARDRARAAPPPDPASAFEDVQDDGAPTLEASSWH
jgi:pyruvate dehydrogenase E1 component alpha subunit